MLLIGIVKGCKHCNATRCASTLQAACYPVYYGTMYRHTPPMLHCSAMLSMLLLLRKAPGDSEHGTACAWPIHAALYYECFCQCCHGFGDRITANSLKQG